MEEKLEYKNLRIRSEVRDKYFLIKNCTNISGKNKIILTWISNITTINGNIKIEIQGRVNMHEITDEITPNSSAIQNI
jgi:hypothetical protein